MMKSLIVSMLFILPLVSCVTSGRMSEASKACFDPVCESRVDTSTVFRSEYHSCVYYFDRKECMEVFARNPKRFMYSMGRQNASESSETTALMMMRITLIIVTSMIVKTTLR